MFGAQAVPVPGELLTRIARDEARTAGFDDPGSEGIDFNDMGATAAPGRRSPVSGCARTPAQLAMDVHAALALGDVNRVAESYHFAGMSSEAGEHALDRLQRLLDRPVLDSRYFGAPTASAGMMQLVLDTGNGGTSAVDFEVRRYAGCYFVRFQDGAPGQTSNL